MNLKSYEDLDMKDIFQVIQKVGFGYDYEETRTTIKYNDMNTYAGKTVTKQTKHIPPNLQALDLLRLMVISKNLEEIPQLEYQKYKALVKQIEKNLGKEMSDDELEVWKSIEHTIINAGGKK